jgi:hypothetical protein
MARFKEKSLVSHAIIVSTAPGMESWLDQCLKSLRPVTGIPVIIYRNTLGTCEGESLRPDPLLDRPVFERRFGRVNMVLENGYLRKWKGCWNRQLVDAWDKRNQASGGRRSSLLEQGWILARYAWLPASGRMARKVLKKFLFPSGS